MSARGETSVVAQYGSSWDLAGKALLAGLVVTGGIASVRGYYSDEGHVCALVSYVLLAVLVALALFGHRLQKQIVRVPKPGAARRAETVRTGVGAVQMVGGAAGVGPLP